MAPGYDRFDAQSVANDPVDWLASIEAIRASIYRYCSAIDRGQYHWMNSIFHDDATIGTGPSSTGRDEFVDGLRSRQNVVACAVHMIGNVLIEPAGPDGAFAESYGLALEQRAETPKHPASDRILRLRYADHFERRDGTWKIARRLIVLDHVITLPIPAGQRRDVGEGKRDERDPALQLRRSLGLPI